MSIPFVHLHTHSDYSLLDGAQSVKSIVKQAAKFGMPAVALTDHGSMAGSFDLMVLIEGSSMREVAMFVANKLSTLDSVLSTSTNFVLKKYKDHGTYFVSRKEDERLRVSP